MTRTRLLLTAVWAVLFLFGELALVVIAAVNGWNGHYAAGTFALAIVITCEVFAIHTHTHREAEAPAVLLVTHECKPESDPEN